MRRNPVTVWIFLLSLLVGAAAFALVSDASSSDYGTLALGSSLFAISNLVLIYLVWDRDIYSGPLIYLTLFILFHLAVIWTLGVSGEGAVAAVSNIAFLWIKSPYLATAVLLSCIGCMAYTLGCLVGRNVFHDSAKAPAPHQPHRWAGTVGLTTQILGIAMMLNLLAGIGGVTALSGGYGQFLESGQNSTTGYAIWLIGVGSCFSQFGTRGQRRSGLVLFMVFALIFFPIGLRGSILFPAVVLIAVRAKLGWPMRLPILVGGSVLALFLAAIVRLSRVGISGPAETWYASAASTLTELGFSLRPTVEVLKWEGAGADKTNFVSFIAVPLRFIEKMTGWHGGPPATDYRLFNVKINDLVGPIGGSPIAEGYDAAGVFGVVAIMTLIALLISRFSTRKGSTFSALAFPVVLLPLVIAVRNSFAPVIVQLAFGLALAWLASRARGATELDRDGITDQQALMAKSPMPRTDYDTVLQPQAPDLGEMGLRRG